MNEEPSAPPPAALDETAPGRKAWVKPEIQELDHELTNNQSPYRGGQDGLAYSGGS